MLLPFAILPAGTLATFPSTQARARGVDPMVI
jgi:hypothetical protein